MPKEFPLAILPTPTAEEVEEFAVLYRKKYGVELDPGEAGRRLGGLMRFFYLTRTNPPTKPEDGDLPAHSTQLTARKGRQSRKNM